MIRMNPVIVKLPDDSSSTVELFSHSDTSSASDDTVHPIVIVWPGFGMGARYYSPMAQELARRGCDAAVGELRGHGTNTAVATRHHEFGYQEHVTEDFPLTINAVRQAFGADFGELANEDAHGRRVPVFFLCHSLSGQMTSLYLARPDVAIDGAIFVGAGSPWNVLFGSRMHKRLKKGAAVMRRVSHVLGYWPSGIFDIPGYGRQSRRMLKEWANYSVTGTVYPTGADIDYAAEMTTVTKPILSIILKSDEDCPPASAKHLLEKLPNALVEIEENLSSVGHNRWAREPEPVATRAMSWLKDLGAYKPSHSPE